MKLIIVAGVLLSITACTTLENRRDLYSPDVELYSRPITTTQTTSTKVQTVTRKTPPQVRPIPAEPEDASPLPTP